MERLLALFTLFVLLGTSNSPEKSTPVVPSSEVDSTKPNGPSRSVTTGELNGIMKKINQHWKEIEERHPINIQMAGVGQDHIMIEIRSFGDVEHSLSEAEIEAVKKTLFEFAGSEFPIKLSVRTCCVTEADITGKITKFDKEQNRILIVNEHKKNGNTDDPESAWVKLTPDGILIVGESKVTSGFDNSFIGQEARAWSTGVILASYPGQASAVKVVVE